MARADINISEKNRKKERYALDKRDIQLSVLYPHPPKHIDDRANAILVH